MTNPRPEYPLEALTPEAVSSSASSTDSFSSATGSPIKENSDDEIHSLLSPAKLDHGDQSSLANLCVNAIRFLCVDAINHVNSGHPGICMGMAPAAFVLFDKHMNFNPRNPNWPNRDRFVLSAGHGSMLLYAMLFMYGYESISLDDIKQFRQLGSKTPGHPECAETPGVEVCSGPLGQGLCNAVGIAMAEAHVASAYNRPDCAIVDNYTYCIAGDGCLMEGLTAEACSLAGHLQLGKLIVLYDDNHMSIDGCTDLAFTEDVGKRFESYQWQVLHVKDGNRDLSAINSALWKAKQCSDKPTLIKISTTIGYGAPNKGNTPGIHGSAVGDKETRAAKEALGYEYAPFEIPFLAMKHFRRKKLIGALLEKSWQDTLEQYSSRFPDQAELFRKQVLDGTCSPNVELELRKTALLSRNKAQATRKHSKLILNAIAQQLPSFVGGAADTSPSTLTDLECSKDFTKSNRMGRNIRFGVREHAMAAIANGIALSGYSLRPFCATFFVFSDYMRAAMRMASLSRIGTIFVATHDSVGLGEDGPSHQPIEHLASFRAMPNHDVWRPADGIETGAAYSMALSSNTRPSTIVLSRQSTPALEVTYYEKAKRGGYVALDSGNPDFPRDGIIAATGTELVLAVEAAQRLRAEYGLHARVVSLPCWEEFERQDKAYKHSVFCLPRNLVVSVEAGSSFGWSKYADYNIGIEEFGRSGDGAMVLADFGITARRVLDKFLEMRAARA